VNAVPFWIEAVVSGLLVMSGVFVLVSAIGFLRAGDFFLRMHPPAIAYTLGTWSVAAAGVLFFSALEGRPALHPWLLVVVLSITVPVTTVLLSRVALFRRRAAGDVETPPPLSPPASQGEESRLRSLDGAP
jgi:multicomponent K+:H+ antiporter subunit G